MLLNSYRLGSFGGAANEVLITRRDAITAPPAQRDALPVRAGDSAACAQRRGRDYSVTNRRQFLAIVGSAILPLSLTTQGVRAQATQRRIGYLSAFPRADIEPGFSLLRRELEKLGWVDGRNIVLLEPLTTDGRNERMPDLARELVTLAPDVIIVLSAPAMRAALQATKSIPIVMVAMGNPAEYGIVHYSKPGGNVTGSTFVADESARKLLQLLKEAVPRLRSVAVLSNPTNETAAPMLRQLLRADAVLHGITVHSVDVSSPADFELAFAAIRRDNLESILLPPEPLVRSKREAIGDFAQRHGLPLAVVGPARFLPPGGLIAYSPASSEYPRLTARYVDEILKGAKPGDLPIQQPTLFELTVNLKTAKALGLKLPTSILTSATEVIQ